MENFEDFVSEERWNSTFDTPLRVYLTKVGDPNLKIFMEMEALGNDTANKVEEVSGI